MIGLMHRIHNSEIAIVSKDFKAFRVCKNKTIQVFTYRKIMLEKAQKMELGNSSYKVKSYN